MGSLMRNAHRLVRGSDSIIGLGHVAVQDDLWLASEVTVAQSKTASNKVPIRIIHLHNSIHRKSSFCSTWSAFLLALA